MITITLGRQFFNIQGTECSADDADWVVNTLTEMKPHVFAKTDFYDVILFRVGDRCINVIKTIREWTNLPLQEVKTMTETPNAVIEKGVPAERAVAVRTALVKEGATVQVLPAK